MNDKKINNKELINKIKLENTKKLKQQYFEYYDDVKSHTNKIIDW